MRELDVKHVAYHVLVGLYFIWLPLFAILIAFTLNSVFYSENIQLNRILLLWILLNLIIGTSLYAVIRLFGKKGKLEKVISYSYFVMAGACITTVLITLK